MRLAACRTLPIASHSLMFRAFIRGSSIFSFVEEIPQFDINMALMGSAPIALSDGPLAKRRRLRGKQPPPHSRVAAAAAPPPTPAGPVMTVMRSGGVSLLQDVIISGFSDGMLG